jgi:Adenine-specific methyltransferase EcoRI
MAGKEALAQANRAKMDEFYTQLADIERELRHYKHHFKGKVVYCNCDDPRVSDFFHYFSYNFERLGLKKLITTCYKSQNADLFSQNDSEEAIWLEYQGDKNGNNVPDPEEIGIHHLAGDGDFRSPECVELLKQSDIVVTNPPFSKFREYVSQLVEYDKKFLIIGNMNAVTYDGVFSLFQANKLWYGVSIHSGDREFGVPRHYPLTAATSRVDEAGNKFIRVKGVRWFTNMDHSQRHETLILYKKYNPDEYPTYDNYDAIEVSKTAEIPMDYPGAIGVPITFLDKYNPDQFEILGWTRGRDEFEAWPTKRYVNARQLNPDGTESGGGKVNTGPTLLLAQRPVGGTGYVADGVNGYLVQTYMRIVVRNRELTEANL